MSRDLEMVLVSSTLILEAQPSHLLFLFAAVSSLALAYLFTLLSLNTPGSNFWKSLPCVRRKQQWWSWARATLRSITESQSMVAEGYAKYSKSNIPFVLPSMATGPTVIVPPSQMRHILSKPESEIDGYGSQNETIQAPYTIKDKEIYLNRFHFDVVRKQLAKNLPLLTMDMAEELALGFEQYWGTSTEWVSVRAWESVLKIVARAANRVFVGLPLCRNEEFLEHSRKYSMSVFGGGTVINMFPACLRSIVGPLVALAGKRHLAICNRLCATVVEERLENNQRKKDDPNFQWDPPDDGLQWVIDECYKSGDRKQLEPTRITHRLLVLNLVAIHSTSFTTTNTILDLYSSSPSDGFVSQLREECDRVLFDSDGIWTQDAVSKLFRVDSTIRESMRFSAFGIVALPRRVSAPEGIEFDDNVRIPKDVRLGIPMHEIHHDRAFYSNPSYFDAFRFSRPHETDKVEMEITETKDTVKDLHLGGEVDAITSSIKVMKEDTKSREHAKTTLGSKQPSVVTGGDTFLSFGHGKHSCPGRFFASQEMKLMLAHLLQHYDVEYMAERPAQQAIMENKLPSNSTNIRVRRKTMA